MKRFFIQLQGSWQNIVPAPLRWILRYCSYD